MVRAFLSWDRPDRAGTDFTFAAYHAFRDRFTTVTTAADPRPDDDASLVLARLELARAEEALRLDSLDIPLALRCVLAAYPSGDSYARQLLACITGEPATEKGKGTEPALSAARRSAGSAATPSR